MPSSETRQVPLKGMSYVLPRHDAFTRSPWVLVVRDGKVERVPVRTGLRTEMTVEILDGIAEGEWVIPTAAGDFRAGESVLPVLPEVQQ